VNFARFERNLYNAIASEPKLLECDPREVCREVAKIAALGLYIDPALGEAYLITGFSHGRTVPQGRIGYRGLIKLARQTGEISEVYAREVCAGDEFECIEGTDRFLRHKPDYFDAERGHPVGFYAVIRYRDGGSDFEVMGRKSIDRIRDRSDAYKAFAAGKIKSTPWSTDYDEMAKKTVIRRLVKRNPLSPDVTAAFAMEENAEAVGEAQERLSSQQRTNLQQKLLNGQQRVSVETKADPETGEIAEDEGHDVSDETLTTETSKTKAAKPSEKPQEADRGSQANNGPQNEEPASQGSTRKPKVYLIDLFEDKCKAVTNWADFERAKLERVQFDSFKSPTIRRAEAALSEAEKRLEAIDAKNAEREVDHGPEDQGEEPEEIEAEQEPVQNTRDEIPMGGDEGTEETTTHERAVSFGPAIPAGNWDERTFRFLTNVATSLAKQTTAENLGYEIDGYRETVKHKTPAVQDAFAILVKEARDRFKPGAV
jgi:recombination protein RecT